MAKQVKKVNEPRFQAGRLIAALILISFGVLTLLSELNVINFNFDYFLLVLGLIFVAIYFVSRMWAFLIPGVILSLIGLILLLNLHSVSYLFTLAVGLSFIAVYLTRQPFTIWAIIPGGILIGVSVLIAFQYYTSIDAMPILLILAGLYLIVRNYFK